VGGVPTVLEFGVYSLLFFHFVLTWALKTNALRLSNYMDSLDTELSQFNMEI
jgi:hypothetical protein